MEKWVINKRVYEADEINPNLAVSPWSGHRQFAYDLVTYVKPQRIVELGTHYGCSFFSFLQACKDEKLDTEVVAIDCWEGDEQAGFYGDEVLDTVKETLEKKFSEQNYRLIRKYFADALTDIEDESVDILHIDGLHTYEAVSEDYRTWLCKLKSDGIILFHDVASELGYGTNKFWMELQKEFPESYTFTHSWGLGVLFPKGKKYYDAFAENNMQDKIKIYEYEARYALEHRQLQDHIIMVQERDKSIKANEKMISEKDELIAKCEELIKARDEAIRSNEKLIDQKDEVIAKCEEMIRARDEAIKSNEKMIDEGDALIKQYEEKLAKMG